MRGLQTKDLFGMGRILKEIGLREEIERISRMVQRGEKADSEAAGLELIASVIEKAVSQNCEKAVYNFVAALFECEPIEVETMNPVEMLDKLVEVANINEWTAFFSKVRSLFLKK